MGKLVVSEFISLDGVVEDPGGGEGTAFGGWTFRFPADDGQRFKFEELLASDVQLLGRVTYEGFAAAWPAMEETTGEFGAKMNAMPKVVVSTTLTDPAWKNTTVDSGADLPGLVAGLKERYAGDILVAGSASLVAALREHDLVDEYRLMLHPVVVGPGKRLFADGSTPADLALAECRPVGPDVLLLTYRPANRSR
ncbi:dihydrofolate reductase family protein [Dactylosporangium sp. AC04546]|uniref:dihydrofolate reductase family protein n=1 Tax=Dactylosporangium sp. AC04546 TaxID=2862460 RepID=UPI001EDF07C7|nr:dihydrofolate reductase family protein [Dactylosporangium sp. AC04546]WVK86638.1 dihydrofolate reductase family protein [Dactylosporangium sp. AC04546]